MRRLVAEAIAAGAVGFSHLPHAHHTDLDGEPVPGTFAADDELIGLAEAMVEAGGGLFEVVPHGRDRRRRRDDPRRDRPARRGVEGHRRPVSFLLVQSTGAPDLWRDQLDARAQGQRRRRRLIPQVAARPGGMLLGVASYHGLMRRPTYRRLEDCLPLDELLAELQEARGQGGHPVRDRPPGRSAPPVRGPHRSTPYMFGRIFPLKAPLDYEPTPEMSIDGLAAAAGADPWEVLYDHLADGELLLGAFTNYAQTTGDPLERDARAPRHRRRPLRRRRPREDDLRRVGPDLPAHPLGPRPHPRRPPLARDGRAQAGAATAEVVGLTDRGTIEVGKKADLNVIDFENLELHEPRSVDDLPAGGRRILQDVTGYVATIVSGVVTRPRRASTPAPVPAASCGPSNRELPSCRMSQWSWPVPARAPVATNGPCPSRAPVRPSCASAHRACATTTTS